MKRKNGNGGDPDDRRATDAHNLPVPDPTKLTQEAVDRAIASYREVVNEQLKNRDTRLDGMDRATDLLATELEKLTTNLLRESARLKEESSREQAAIRESYQLQIQTVVLTIKSVADVDQEKFAGIETRFAERDTRTAQTADESRISLDAALAAAKEAVSLQNEANSQAIAKSEVATQKQIDAMTELMRTSTKALDDKITDLKGRLDRGEGQEKGTTQTRQQNQLQSNWSIGSLIAVGIAVLSTVATIIIAALRH